MEDTAHAQAGEASRFKRPDLVLHYQKPTEVSDGIYDLLQLLSVVCSFATIYFAVASADQNRATFWCSLFVVISAFFNRRRTSDIKHVFTVSM